MIYRLLLTIACVASTATALSALSSPKKQQLQHPEAAQPAAAPLNRRNVLGSVAAAAAAFLVIPTSPANAFENKISTKYDDRPKQRGGMPRDLGISSKRKDMVGEEYTGLKSCGAAPNCFCSTDSMEDDPEHVIPAWKWPVASVSSMEDAFVQLEQTVSEYKPGQDNIDGGGFKIVTSKPGYIYAQFEAFKNGYIDDLEFAAMDGAVQVRSSSRLGYLDYGVNAKRLNYIAAAMRKQGWEAEGVDFKKHLEYASQNRVEM
eukprot:CAMPEP_0119004264 /NCGR_PEP_ID=MMETSP1176-20130426/1047_1 /TAXON_ID=265551 /ORGANISM="Synedropsis recta cf, Strain CCMP1620" /LENGTH=259 /DNA_ID=CAMNT_0006955949 /DNA_START=61 /DNA_END=840 /DNA_ORIENTATION=+